MEAPSSEISAPPPPAIKNKPGVNGTASRGEATVVANWVGEGLNTPNNTEAALTTSAPIPEPILNGRENGAANAAVNAAVNATGGAGGQEARVENVGSEYPAGIEGKNGIFPPVKGNFPPNTGIFPGKVTTVSDPNRNSQPASEAEGSPQEVQFNEYGEIEELPASSLPADSPVAGGGEPNEISESKEVKAGGNKWEGTLDERSARLVNGIEGEYRRVADLLSRTNLSRILRIGLVALIPLLLGRDQGGPAAQNDSNSDQSQMASAGRGEFNPRTQIFQQLHRGILESLQREFRKLVSPHLTDGFIVPGPSKIPNNIEPTKREISEIPIQVGKLGYEVRIDKPGESAKGMAEKYFAIFSDRIAALRTLINLQQQGVSVDINGYLDDISDGKINEANQRIMGALLEGEKKGIQLPGEMYAQAIARADPAARERYVSEFMASIGGNNPDTPLAGDGITRRITGIRSPLDIYNNAILDLGDARTRLDNVK